MQRKFLTNLGLLLSLNLLVKPFWIFGIDRTVQNIVGVSDYGFYFVIFNFSFLFNILLDLGITNFNNRNIAQNNHLLNKHFSGIIVLKLLLAVFYLLVTFIVALARGYHVEQLKLLGFLAFNQVLTSFILYLRSNVSGLLFFKTDSVLSVLDRFLMIVFCGVLLWGHVTTTPFRIEWFVYSQTAAYLITALVAFLIVMKKARLKKLNWNWPFFLMIIKQSFPFSLLVLLMTLYNRLDPIMIDLLLGKKTGSVQAGIYASGFRILDAVNNIAYLFSVLLLPIFARMIKDKKSIEQMVKLSFTLIITPAIIVAAGSIFYSHELMGLLYNAHIDDSASVFQLLMGGFVAVSTSYIFGTLLTANGNLKHLNFIALGGLIVNFTVNLLLIPRLQAVGSAYSSLITQFFTAVIQVILAQQIFRFKVNYRYLSVLLIFIVGVILFNYLSLAVHPGSWFIHGYRSWLLNFLFMVVFSLILAGGLGLLNVKTMMRILREDR